MLCPLDLRLRWLNPLRTVCRYADLSWQHSDPAHMQCMLSVDSRQRSQFPSSTWYTEIALDWQRSAQVRMRHTLILDPRLRSPNPLHTVYMFVDLAIGSNSKAFQSQ